MSRRKPKPEPVLHSWDEVDDALLEIGQLDRQVEEIEATMEAEVEEAKRRAKKEAVALLAKRARHEANIKEFAAARKSSDLADRKTRRLPFGSVGYRLARKLATEKRGLKWDTVLEHLLAMGKGAAQFVRTKHEVDKDALRKAALDGGDVSPFRVRIVATDEFWYEIDQLSLDKVTATEEQPHG